VHTSAFGPENTSGKFALEPWQEHTEGWPRPPALITPPAQTRFVLDSAKRWWGEPPAPRARLGAATLLPLPPCWEESGGGKPTTLRSPTAPAAFSGIPKFGRSLFLQHPPPATAGRLPNCVFIYFCIFPAPRTDWRGAGGAEAGSQVRPKKKPKGVQLPPFPGDREEAGKRGAGRERGGS